jgi:hypothetical protein
MATILPFNSEAGGSFDEHMTGIMGEAFDDACARLHDTAQPDIVFEVIARRIIGAAGKGERDPIRLRDTALAALGSERLAH